MAVQAQADFVKTSTGFSTGGATPEDVALMSRLVRDKGLGVKASGGVRSLADVRRMVQAGATRIGTSSGIKILQEAAGQAVAAEKAKALRPGTGRGFTASLESFLLSTPRTGLDFDGQEFVPVRIFEDFGPRTFDLIGVHPEWSLPDGPTRTTDFTSSVSHRNHQWYQSLPESLQNCRAIPVLNVPFSRSAASPALNGR